MLGDLVAEQCRGRLAQIDVDPAAGADGRAGEQCGGDRLESIPPVTTSEIVVPIRCGVPSVPTLMETRPENACATESEPGRFEYGPLWPKPLTDR
jgi:hypothetical protein